MNYYNVEPEAFNSNDVRAIARALVFELTDILNNDMIGEIRRNIVGLNKPLIVRPNDGVYIGSYSME